MAAAEKSETRSHEIEGSTTSTHSALNTEIEIDKSKCQQQQQQQQKQQHQQ